MDLDLEDIRALADAATRGPWEADHNGRLGSVIRPKGSTMSIFRVDTTYGPTPNVSRADAEFIAAARQLVPAMADEIERLRGSRAMRNEKTETIVEPSVGRIVHYVSRGSADGVFRSECRAAVITQMVGRLEPDGQWCVGLCVINPTGLFFHEDVTHDEDGGLGTWHWPERV